MFYAGNFEKPRIQNFNKSSNILKNKTKIKLLFGDKKKP